MKVAFLRLAVAICFLVVTQTIKAQSVITEYLDVKKSFSINLNDKKNLTAIYTKGVIDVDWNVQNAFWRLATTQNRRQLKALWPQLTV